MAADREPIRDPIIEWPMPMIRWNENDIARFEPTAPDWMNAEQRAILAQFDADVDAILEEMADAIVENLLHPKG